MTYESAIPGSAPLGLGRILGGRVCSRARAACARGGRPSQQLTCLDRYFYRFAVALVFQKLRIADLDAPASFALRHDIERPHFVSSSSGDQTLLTHHWFWNDAGDA